MAVTVPSALTAMSPVIKRTLIIDPGCSARGSPILPSALAAPPPPSAPCMGSKPSARRSGAKRSKAPRVKPPSDKGVEISINFDCASRPKATCVRSPVTAGSRVTSNISSIGRTPAIGSLANGNANATAPTSRPSMYTGLPLMPCMTPVRSTCAPPRRARMIDCLGPRFSIIPRISTGNSSTRESAKTVLPTPRMPAFTSLRGMMRNCAKARAGARSNANNRIITM